MAFRCLFYANLCVMTVLNCTEISYPHDKPWLRICYSQHFSHFYEKYWSQMNWASAKVWPLKKRPKIGFPNRLSLNAGQKYCRMPQWEHSAILLTFIKLPFVIKICVLSIFERLLKTGFTVLRKCSAHF